MKDRKAASRYAKAFFEDAQERGALDEVLRDLLTLRAIWGRSPDLARYLGHPMVAEEQKKQFCRTQLDQAIAHDSLRYVDLLISRKRPDLLPEITDAFQTMVDDDRGIIRAFVRTAAPLTADEQERLEGLIGRAFGGTPVVVVQTRPELIGGLTVRVKDTYVDGSVRTSLNSIATSLRAVTLGASGGDNSGD